MSDRERGPSLSLSLPSPCCEEVESQRSCVCNCTGHTHLPPCVCECVVNGRSPPRPGAIFLAVVEATSLLTCWRRVSPSCAKSKTSDGPFPSLPSPRPILVEQQYLVFSPACSGCPRSCSVFV
eukprot:Sspe_Gene.28821::Locus_13260_Transcript_1_1_Confidence_1.000_Length_2472::g.28821::m.28821